ncbi:CoA-transferase [Streptomyces griseorubiginosus]|uniref:Uncharacterized protein n=1 Tax=Streptomyces griseorubiginosus TaxID=67304 RepID=A0A101RP78_9ACTN|nr:hypothetical protein AQJ54_40260 [Streptomyces griseorubiginosus]
MDKAIPCAAHAVADIGHGASLAVGGFGLCDIPSTLLDALCDAVTFGQSVVAGEERRSVPPWAPG